METSKSRIKPSKLKRWLVDHRTYVIIAAIVAGVLSFHGISNHNFWDDEANTGIFARNLLEFGELTGWDGRNLIGFRAGAELDENLVNTYMPPMQYYVAAVGIFLFGETTFGGRVLFVLAGLAAIVWLGIFTRRFLGNKTPWVLAPVILSLTPAYLLYIRNCRYYSLGVLFTVTLLAAWMGKLETRRNRILDYSIASVSIVAILLTQYMNAVFVVAAILMTFVFERFRTKRHLFFLCIIGAAGALTSLWILIYINPFEGKVAMIDETEGLDRIMTLLWWHLRGLGTFEFVPVLLIPLLGLPFFVKRLETERPLALKGLWFVAVLLVSCIVTALVSPQPVSLSKVADMRYQVPMIAIGACLSCVVLTIVWKLARGAALVIAIVLLFSNVFHLGFLVQRSGQIEPREVACTLCDYVWENANDYQTSNDVLVDYMRYLPADTVVLVHPGYMVYSAMFYLPELRYACQLLSMKDIREDRRADLPDYLFWDKAEIDWVLISAPPPPNPIGPLSISFQGKKYHFGFYKMATHLKVLTEDRSRPEIPWHSFSPEEWENVKVRGFFVAEIGPVKELLDEYRNLKQKQYIPD
jgi:Dolichyl-phosphate-mannose-protein mannosyltransferase